jgi:hypothetical protein
VGILRFGILVFSFFERDEESSFSFKSYHWPSGGVQPPAVGLAAFGVGKLGSRIPTLGAKNKDAPRTGHRQTAISVRKAS